MIMGSNKIILISLVLLAACKQPPSKISFGDKGGLEGNPGAPGDVEPGNGDDPDNPDGGGAMTPEQKEETDTTVSDMGLTDVDYSTSVPRISYLQWENSVKDLLNLNAAPGKSSAWPIENGAGKFGNDADKISLSDTLTNGFMKAAEEVATSVSGDAAAVAALIPSSAPKSEDINRAKAIVTPFLERAYRRPAKDLAADITSISALFVSAKTMGSDAKGFDASGVRALITVVLQSPRFIYRYENGVGTSGVSVTLDAYEVAARISFGILNTLPDATLLKAAADGSLMQASVRKSQAARLLTDERAKIPLKLFHSLNFSSDTFDFSAAEKQTSPWPAGGMKRTLITESELFFDDIVNKQNKGLNEILTANYTFVNASNAPLYGLTASGTDFVKKALNPKERGGFYSMAGFNARIASDKASHLILRGASVVNDLFCSSLSFPSLSDADKKASENSVAIAKTQRLGVEAGTARPACQTCHATRINPAGSALENYDALGMFRTKESNGEAIDSSGKFAFNANAKIDFKNGVEFMKGAAGRVEVHRCYVSKAMQFLLGRLTFESDAPVINALAKESLAGLGTKDLFAKIYESQAAVLRPYKTQK